MDTISASMVFETNTSHFDAVDPIDHSPSQKEQPVFCLMPCIRRERKTITSSAHNDKSDDGCIYSRGKVLFWHSVVIRACLPATSVSNIDKLQDGPNKEPNKGVDVKVDDE